MYGDDDELTNEFETIDYLGRRVYCSAERWSHICEGHPQFVRPAYINAVIRAIENPFCVTRDKYYPNSRCYYRRLRSPQEGRIVKVVIAKPRFLASRSVITAFDLVSVPTDEEVIYGSP